MITVIIPTHDQLPARAPICAAVMWVIHDTNIILQCHVLLASYIGWSYMRKIS